MWTIDTKFGDNAEWIQSSKRYETKAVAIIKAIEWVEINLWNDVAVAVRIVRK